MRSDKKNLSDQPTKTKISKKRLSNGALLILGEDHSVPLVALQAIFKGGVIAENEKTNGVFQLMTSTAIRGTRSKKSQDIFGPIEALGGDLSAYADQNTFGFSMMVPREAFKNALELLVEILREPSFPKEELEKQKEQCVAAIQTVEESPMSWGFLQLKQKLFAHHPYRFLAYGSRASLGRISREDVVETFEKFCKSNGLVISIFGDIESESALDQVQEILQSLPRGDKPSFLAHKNELKSSLHDRLFRNQEQSLILFGFPGVTVMNNDRYPLEVMATLLSGFSSPLFKKIRNELGAAYYVGAFNLFGLDPGAFIIYAGTTAEKEDQVFRSIQETLEHIRQGQINPEDLLRAKNQLLGEKTRNLQTLTGRAREAALLELYGLGIEELDVYEQKIQSVSKEELVKTAQKYFDEKLQVTLVISPEETLKKESKKE
jgi:zinc protease